MKVLTRDEVRELHTSLWERLPQFLLFQVARRGGRRETDLTSDAMQWLPRDIPAQQIRSRVATCVDWFSAHGDIERAHLGRYLVVPPYALHGPGSSGETRLDLYGDPRVAGRIGQGLAEFGLALAWTAVESHDAEDMSGPAPAVVGVQRWIRFQSRFEESVSHICHAAGIVLYRTSELEARLPVAGDLTVPSTSAATEVNLVGGLWEVYAPTMAENARWQPAPRWDVLKSALVRWRPNDSWDGYRAVRYFYQLSRGRTIELYGESPRLWQLYLDADAGSPRFMWREEHALWVPRVIPTVTQQWIASATGSTPHNRKAYLVVYAPSHVLGHVAAVLERTLQLRVRQGAPSFARPPASTGESTQKRKNL